jgi:hypothetical protein
MRGDGVLNNVHSVYSAHNMYIIYDKTSDWEIDYIKNEILRDFRSSANVFYYRHMNLYP